MDEKIVNEIIRLGREGCRGTPRDFSAWLPAELAPTATEVDVAAILTRLVEAGTFRIVIDPMPEYRYTESLSFPDHLEYSLSAGLSHSPIQMVRSRVASFLEFHNAGEDNSMDILIGITEAMENAVKYNSGDSITVDYSVDENVFSVRIINPVDRPQPERDIEAGKYSGETTLMRGMMVMGRLFDDMDLDLSEDHRIAIFTAFRSIR